MFRPYCRVIFINAWIVVILTCALLTVNVKSDDDDDGGVTTDEPDESDEVTDLPMQVLEAALYKDYGKFTTIDFHYHNHQYEGLSSNDYCYDDYTSCLISLEVPAPVCAYDWSWSVTTRDSYCDVYFENCLEKNRKWRIMAYGKCDSKAYNAVETFRRLSGYNNTNIVQ